MNHLFRNDSVGRARPNDQERIVNFDEIAAKNPGLIHARCAPLVDEDHKGVF